jgi:hypothetical protein
MKKSIRSDSSYYKMLAFVTYLLCFSINVEQAFSAGGSETQAPTITTDPTSPSLTQNTSSLSVTPTTLQQTGANNYANVNSNIGTLNYPNCGGGTCGFAIMRMTSTNNSFNGAGGNQLEAVIGLIISPNSPDQMNAENNRLTVEIQKYKSEHEIIAGLTNQLADAIEAGKTVRANLIAIVLAPKLGRTPEQLLREINPKPLARN